MALPDIPYAGRHFAGCLFDMDGTLLTSIESAERVWSRWLTRFGLDPAVVLPQIHGVQTLETIRRLNIAGIDPQAEADWIAREEIADLDGVRAIAGAEAFLEALPHDRWAIVTSATRRLAEARLEAAGLSAPRLFITAEDIPIGKPAPDCYVEAGRRLGIDAADCLVFEDAAAGIEAGRAAGASVVVITATHTHPIDTGFPSILDYRHVSATHDPSGIRLVARPIPG
jgi:sugar-phosphatase